MPNSFGSQGLTTATQSELVSTYTDGFQTAYGSQINLGPETPDGQMIMIPIQTALDQSGQLVQILNSFNPDTAFGAVLDQRVAINGIQRQAGTYTTVDVQLVLSSSVNLYGLDQTAQSVYTVQDAAGNEYELTETQLGIGPGTSTLLFQAAQPGALAPTPNSITLPVTIVLGVTSINNPSAAVSIGINEESDAALRIRRAQSVALSSRGFYDGLLAALENVPGVTYAFVEENNSGTTNSDGVPGHSIWVIVAGSGSPSQIAQAIYTKRDSGTGMYGSQTYSVTRANGSTFPINWDIVSEQPVFYQFTLSSLDGATPPNVPKILGSLAALFVPGVASQVNINEGSTLIQELDPNSLVTGAGFSNGLIQYISLSGVPASGSFKLTYGGSSTALLAWNASVTAIQSAVQGLPGLGSATVAGSLASQSLTVTLTGVSSPTLIGVSSNTVQTSAPAAVAFSFLSSGYTNTLSPSAKNKQLATSSPNFIALPVYVNGPQVTLTVGAGSNKVVSSLSIAPLGSQTLAGIGGYGTYTFSLTTNASGGSCSSAGAYVAGAAAGTDIVTMTDGLGNSNILTVMVT